MMLTLYSRSPAYLQKNENTERNCNPSVLDLLYPYAQLQKNLLRLENSSRSYLEGQGDLVRGLITPISHIVT